MVGVGTVVNPGEGDAAVVRIPGTDQAIALAVDCNSRKCYVDPRQGAIHAVAECSRNVACSGAKPLGTTDCLNFGDPEDPEVMWQFVEAIQGLGEACRALDVPIVGGNVSLYNASEGKDIYPTPTVAVVGAFDRRLDRDDDGPVGFVAGQCVASGDVVVLLGETKADDLGASEYLWQRTGSVGASIPSLDLDTEASLQALVGDLVSHRLIRSAHDCAEGGLGVALVEKVLGTGFGLRLDGEVAGRPDHWLFSESPSRVLVSCRSGRVDDVVAAARKAGIAAAPVATVTDTNRLIWDDRLDLDLDHARRAHSTALSSLE
jgi:phosphoribosylformylglycinamidine synthase